MASLMWNHSCSVGVQAMDNQHGILLDALNELRTALLKGTESKVVRAMLARVSELMRLHAESEERLLALYDYPGLAAHKAEHQRLLGRLAQFDVRFEQRQSGAVYELVEYLRKWFTNHTGVSGQKYGPWLQKCGVQ
ncbi:bacteriohemerythrin [Acidicapsa acidisoli]|uniref:bacteriohemerythrin n=1 Tax=Acidicapsa acidisoli TaxID=1615681 RepID=UPI0021DF743B|nr:bacteriohemerythrin [Acidicapsa acidisoli]